MCEIFPEVEKCCLIVSLRLGMLFISVLCIMTGVTLLCIVEQRNNVSYKSLQNITSINKPEKALKKSSQVIVSGLAAMAGIFMVTGVILMFATLTDQEGLVQVFVWVMFLNVLFGLVLSIVVGLECLVRPKCLFTGVDWLSASAALVMFIAYLFLWLYFIFVANSYVLNVFS